MKHSIFSKWLKVIIVGTTLIGLACCIFVVPFLADIFKHQYPEFSYWVLPWMLALYITAVPCFLAMGISWKIASNIGKDKSFCHENARLFFWYSRLAFGDSVFFLVVSVIYWLVGMNHPGLLIADLLVVFIGMAVFCCTAALSYLVEKAAKLQDENDLTI